MGALTKEEFVRRALFEQQVKKKKQRDEELKAEREKEWISKDYAYSRRRAAYY